MQIYEWCCHVRQATECKDNHDNTTSVVALKKSKELPADWKLHLTEYYAKKITVYSCILEEYEKAKLQFRRSQRLSEFPSLEHWTPSARVLQPYQKSLLLGPSLTVHILKKATQRIHDTNQMITYTAASYDTSSRIASSYVCINPGNESLQFGRILQLYQHSFCDHTCIICEINLFQPAAYDDAVNMWFVPQKPTDKTVLHFITVISQPLIISVDEADSFIWFLNYTVKNIQTELQKN